MRVCQLLFLVPALLFIGGTHVSGQSLDAAGHWTGSVQLDIGPLTLELDLTRDAAGQLTGTLSVPQQNLRALPLTVVSAEGASVKLVLQLGQPTTFTGTLSADGATLTGTAVTAQGEATFSLTRAGAARAAARLRNAPVPTPFSGVWVGTLDVRGGMRVELTIENQSDDSATALFMSVDESRLTVPMAITVGDGRIRLESPNIGSTYDAALSTDHGTLEGRYTTGQGESLPLRLTRRQ